MRVVPGLGIGLISLLAGCKWFVTEARIFDAKDRDDDGFAAVEAGGDDCDDSDPQIHPSAVELCDDGVDNNCDGQVDDHGVGTVIWYADDDGDGFGVETYTREACASWASNVWSTEPGDCDDTDPAIHPGVDDNDCDGVDEDCDGLADDDAPEGENRLWYADVDGDLFGDPASEVSGCVAPVDHVADASDCDDLDATINPRATERCDGVDNDCDGTIDLDDTTVATVRDVNYGSLEAALSGVGSSGVVEICPGSHRLNQGSYEVPAGTIVTVRGSTGRESTTLTEIHGEAVMRVVGGGLTVEGLSLTGAIDGAAPVEVDAGTLLVSDSHLSDNEGPGLRVAPTSGVPVVTIQDTSIERNDHASASGGGITVLGDAALTLRDCVLADNTTGIAPFSGGREGGGLYFAGTGVGNLTMEGCTVERNEVLRDGGSGGGIYLYDLASVDISSSTFEANVTPSSGGGIYVQLLDDNAPLHISNTELRDNEALTGGGAYLGTTATVPGTWEVIETQVAENAGVGLYVDHRNGVGTVDIASSTFSDNQGLGIYANNASLLGDGATLVSGNTSSEGGGLYLRGILGDVTVRDLEVSGNSSTGNGGGAHIRGTVGTVTLNNVTISGNTAREGGGIWTLKRVMLDEDCEVTSNSATDGGGAFVSGGSGRLDSNGAFWGDAATATDNTPHDIEMSSGSTYDFESEVFLCTGGSCQ